VSLRRGRDLRREKDLKELRREIQELETEKSKAFDRIALVKSLKGKTELSLLLKQEEETSLETEITNYKMKNKDLKILIRTFRKEIRKSKREIEELDNLVLSLNRRKKLRENRIERKMSFNPSKREK